MEEEARDQVQEPRGRRLAGALAVGAVMAALGAFVTTGGFGWIGPEAEEAPRLVRSASPRQGSAPGRPPRKPDGQLKAGDRAPALTLPDLKGTMRSLEELRGRPVVLNIWASWCPPCIREMPSLEKLHRVSGDSLHVVSVAVDEDVSQARALAGRLGLTFPVLLDPGGDQAARWGTVMFPETWILDAEGAIVDRLVGEQDWTDPAVVARLRGGTAGR